jgi:hypothetical protein
VRERRAASQAAVLGAGNQAAAAGEARALCSAEPGADVAEPLIGAVTAIEDDTEGGTAHAAHAGTEVRVGSLVVLPAAASLVASRSLPSV